MAFIGHDDGFLPDDRGFSESYGILAGGSESSLFNRDMMFPAKNVRLPLKRFKKGDIPGVEAEPTYRNGEVVEDKYKGEQFDQVYTNELIKMIDGKKDDGKPSFAYLPFNRHNLPLQHQNQRIKIKSTTTSSMVGIRFVKTALNAWRRCGVIPKDADISSRTRVLSRPLGLLSGEETTRVVWQEDGGGDGHDGDARPTSWSGCRLPKRDRGGEYDNTYIMYLADNGPEAADITGKENIRARSIPPHAAPQKTSAVLIRRSGGVNSSVSLGPEWASASTGGLSWYKSVHGRRWYSSPPSLLSLRKLRGAIKRCNPALKPMTCHKWKDIAATILEIADVEHPGTE